ncbi:hypothetical protein WBJ53_14950 [Spirosoma sp. SC4-14]|uniref:hypothetical protein n=1 Tax=Spirosoma sp. SC4-14 TaxID=3128900 RepID=UPI0030CE6F24
MLDELQGVADCLGMVFGYGQPEDLLAIAQDITGFDPPYILFHEGYFNATLAQDGQGALEYTHSMVLDICTPSDFADLPDKRKQYLDGLKPQLHKVYKQLTKRGEIKSASVLMGLNVTARNLDVIKLTLTIKTPAVSLCRL